MAMTCSRFVLPLLMLWLVSDSLSVPLSSNTNSAFKLQINPVTIVRGVTPNVTLTCQRKISTSVTSEDIFYVSTIRILRQVNGTWSLAASIRDNEGTATSHQADITSVFGNLTSSENNDNNSGKIDAMNFLKIVWPVATPETFAVYRCDVMGFTSSLDAVVESSPEYLVSENDVTTKGLLDFLLQVQTDTEKEIQSLKDEIKDLSEQQEQALELMPVNMTERLEKLEEYFDRYYYGK